MTTPTCAGCRFFDETFNGHGVCRRNAPTLHATYGGVSERDGQVMTSELSGWPDVDATDWCGQFEPTDPGPVCMAINRPIGTTDPVVCTRPIGHVGMPHRAQDGTEWES